MTGKTLKDFIRQVDTEVDAFIDAEWSARHEPFNDRLLSFRKRMSEILRKRDAAGGEYPVRAAAERFDRNQDRDNKPRKRRGSGIGTPKPARKREAE